MKRLNLKNLRHFRNELEKSREPGVITTFNGTPSNPSQPQSQPSPPMATPPGVRNLSQPSQIPPTPIATRPGVPNFSQTSQIPATPGLQQSQARLAIPLTTVKNKTFNQIKSNLIKNIINIDTFVIQQHHPLKNILNLD